MGDFNTIYKILAALRASMDYEEFDSRLISAEYLKISEPRRVALMMMLVQAGYITGITFDEGAGGDIMMSISRPRLTLKGLEYLEENTLMKKAYRAVKGIKEILP